MTTNGEHFLVTGAAGCIGAWTVRLLLDAGVQVTASDLADDLPRLRLISADDQSARPDFVRLDVTSTSDVAEVVASRGITHIVHLAGLQLPFCAANPPLGAAVNVGGTVNIFEAVKAAPRPVGLCYASSAAVFGSSSLFSAGVIGDDSPLRPDSHYGVYKAANEGTARTYSMSDGIGSVGLRPFIVYGPGRDQGLTSDPTVAMLAAAAGVPFHIKYGGNLLLTYAADCAGVFIAAARAAAGSGDAICLNVPGRRVSVPALIDLIEAELPAAKGLITYETAPIKVPALLSGSALDAVIGEVPNRELADGVRETLARFTSALAAGLLKPPGS
jgi:nucleoside-diphosphate-sugar epimerase